MNCLTGTPSSSTEHRSTTSRSSPQVHAAGAAPRRLASKAFPDPTSSKDSPAVPARYPHGSGRPSPAVCDGDSRPMAAPGAPTPRPSPWSKRCTLPGRGSRSGTRCRFARPLQPSKTSGRASDQLDRFPLIDPAAHQRHAAQVLSGPATRRHTAATTYSRPSQLSQADGATGDEGARGRFCCREGGRLTRRHSDLLTRALSLGRALTKVPLVLGSVGADCRLASRLWRRGCCTESGQDQEGEAGPAQT